MRHTFDSKHYLPVLKGRQGEYRALRALTPADKAAMTPMVEAIPIPVDHAKNRAPKSTIEKHLAKVPKDVEKHWGTAPIFIDVTKNLGPGAMMADGRHPVTYLCEESRKLGLTIIPVISIHADPTFRSAAKAAITVDKNGVCLRHALDDVLDPTFPSTLATLLADLKIGAAEVHFVIDLDAVQANRVGTILAALKAVLPKLPHLHAWASLSLVGTAFPVNFSGFKVGRHTLPRLEWQIWKSLGPQPRVPTFGDYAIAHPEMSDMDPRKMRISASIRYTTDAEWVIYRGRNVKDHGYGEYVIAAGKLAADPVFCGPSFSWGDQYIADCAAGTDGPGAHETWRRVGTNHHLSFVVQQLSSRFAASVPAARAS